MGLENLKSIFGDINTNSVSTGRHVSNEGIGPDETYKSHTGWISNNHILTGNHSASELNIDAEFNINGDPLPPFNTQPLLDATTYAYDSINNIPLEESLFTPPLLKNIFENPNTTTKLNEVGSNLRFQAGFGWPTANMFLSVATDGFQGSLHYINTQVGSAIGLSGALSKFGEVDKAISNASNMASKVGLNTPSIPALDFNLNIKNPLDVPFLPYQNTVEELFNPEGNNLTDEFANTGNPDSTRGIIFQVLGDKNKKGEEPDFRFQDSIQNTADVVWQNPIAGFSPGKIKFKNTDSFLDKALSKKKPSMDSLKKLGDKGADFGDKIKESKFIQGTGKLIGGWGEDIVGFGKKIGETPFMQGVAKFGKGIGQAAKEIGGVGITIAKDLAAIPGDIASDIKTEFPNLNPIESIELPKIKLQSPIASIDKTGYGGQAKFKSNSPRALSNFIPIATVGHNEHLGKGDIEKAFVNLQKPQGPAKKGSDEKEFKKGKQSTPYSELGKTKYADPVTAYYPQKLDNKSGGDIMTLAPLFKDTPDLSAYDKGGVPDIINSQDNGMPLYFKDLRDNTYLIFRAYLEGITENVSPTWEGENYVGRSEPVYVYGGAERDVSFNLKLAAGTALELDAIYSKMHKLTSLCYPEYMEDQFFTVESGKEGNSSVSHNTPPKFKTRQKPPLIKFRLGELYGNSINKANDGVLAFFKSLTYTFPDEGPWETRKGQRVPKMVDVSFSLQILHKEVGNKDSVDFYGYYPTLLRSREPSRVNEGGGVNIE